ncbi:hypothetical protein LC574_29610, partial [Nostoc sp. CHAB 5715]|nr:hypothetical protein [Nostoc sp. CHAB 5715]
MKYTFKKLMELALDGLFGFSNFPLRMATYLGFIIAIPSFLVGFFFIVHRIIGFKIFGHSPGETPGTATLAVGMYFLGGVFSLFNKVWGFKSRASIDSTFCVGVKSPLQNVIANCVSAA